MADPPRACAAGGRRQGRRLAIPGIAAAAAFELGLPLLIGGGGAGAAGVLGAFVACLAVLMLVAHRSASGPS